MHTTTRPCISASSPRPQPIIILDSKNRVVEGEYLGTPSYNHHPLSIIRHPRAPVRIPSILITNSVNYTSLTSKLESQLSHTNRLNRNFQNGIFFLRGKNFYAP
jgi:hypothetical protein